MLSTTKGKANVEYKQGSANDSRKSLAAERPSHLKNKVLVISRISKAFSPEQLKVKINEIAGKRINFLYKPYILSKAFQKSHTIAFELNEEDYNILSDVTIWDSSMRVAEFKGRKFWRDDQPKMSHRERKNAVRDQWN